MAIKQLSVFVENKPGMLRDVISSISGSGVNIRAMSIADTKDYGILRLIVSDIDKAKSSLAEDCLSAANDVIAVEMSDEAGSLSKILNILGEKSIDIDYLYAFTAHTERGAYVVLRVTDDIEKAESVLKENGVVMLTEDHIRDI